MKKRSGVKRLARFVVRGGRRHAGPAGPLEKRPKCVLFDFDGTLGDTFDAGVEILNVLALWRSIKNTLYELIKI